MFLIQRKEENYYMKVFRKVTIGKDVYVSFDSTPVLIIKETGDVEPQAHATQKLLKEAEQFLIENEIPYKPFS